MSEFLKWPSRHGVVTGHTLCDDCGDSTVRVRTPAGEVVQVGVGDNLHQCRVMYLLGARPGYCASCALYTWRDRQTGAILAHLSPPRTARRPFEVCDSRDLLRRPPELSYGYGSEAAGGFSWMGEGTLEQAEQQAAAKRAERKGWK